MIFESKIHIEYDTSFKVKVDSESKNPKIWIINADEKYEGEKEINSFLTVKEAKKLRNMLDEAIDEIDDATIRRSYGA